MIIATNLYASRLMNGMSGARSISLHDGEIPTAKYFHENWNTLFRPVTTGNANTPKPRSYLSHTSNPYFGLTVVGGQTAVFCNNMSAITWDTIKSGNATYAVIWMNVVNAATLKNTSATYETLSYDPFPGYFIVPVSDRLGNGIVKMVNTQITIGTPPSVADISFRFKDN